MTVAHLHGAPQHFELRNQLLAGTLIGLRIDGVAHVGALQLLGRLDDGVQVCQQSSSSHGRGGGGAPPANTHGGTVLQLQPQACLVLAA
jgi:hypothetical protein